MSNSGRVCAYCKIGTDLTEEHLFPECIHKRAPSGKTTSIALTPYGDKAVSDPTSIRDVCSNCNNQILSELDTYICELHDQYFHAFVHAGDRIDFRFDFDLLLRWLLKTSYNTSRIRRWRFQKDSALLNYMLGTGPRPIGFHVFLLLVIPTKTSSREWLVRPESEEVPPHEGGASSLDVKNLPGIAQGYLLSLKSYFFFVYREDDDLLSLGRTRVLKTILKQLPGASELSHRNRAVVFSSPVDYMQFHENNPQIQQQTELARQYVQQLEERKKKK